jgi:hypothetical protein
VDRRLPIGRGDGRVGAMLQQQLQHLESAFTAARISGVTPRV